MTTAPRTSAIVAPVLPATNGFPRSTRPTHGAARRGPAPLVSLAPVRRRGWAYAVAAVDDRGWIAIRVLLAELSWTVGAPVATRETGGLLVMTGDPAGGDVVSPPGRVRLPVRVRRRYGITTSCRVLLVADPTGPRLVIHPPGALDAMIAGIHAAAFGDPVSGGGAP